MIESETVDVLIRYEEDPFSSGAEAKQKAGKKKIPNKKTVGLLELLLIVL